MTTAIALGDSLTCGQGVGVRVAPHLTWAARVAARLPHGRLVSSAAVGARVGDVRATQLPSVPDADLVTVLVGLNDVARSGFDAERVRADLSAIVHALVARAPTVLVGRLHDPCRVLWLPAPVRRLVRWRIDQVNAAVDEVAATHSGVHVLDLAGIGVLADRAGWAVDRVHPSVAGHAAIASAATGALRRAGWDVHEETPEPLPAPPSRLARLRWCASYGLPYLATHVGDFGRPALSAWRRPHPAATTPA